MFYWLHHEDEVMHRRIVCQVKNYVDTYIRLRIWWGIEQPLGNTPMIIETSDNRLYSVRETEQADLEHVWFGLPVKRQGGNSRRSSPRQKAPRLAHPVLVRKAASRVVEA